jgi:hypothetical protein
VEKWKLYNTQDHTPKSDVISKVSDMYKCWIV